MLTVNGQRRDAQERPVNFYEPGRESAILVLQDDPPCQREVTIEPRMPETAAVCLYTNLQVGRLGLLGYRTNLVEI